MITVDGSGEPLTTPALLLHYGVVGILLYPLFTSANRATSFNLHVFDKLRIPESLTRGPLSQRDRLLVSSLSRPRRPLVPVPVQWKSFTVIHKFLL